MLDSVLLSPCAPGHVHVHVFEHYFQTAASVNSMAQMKQTIAWSFSGKGEQKYNYINGPCHMTMVADMPIYGNSLYNYSF